MPETPQPSHPSLKPRWHKGLVKRLLIVGVIIAVLAAIVMLINYRTTPHARFTLKKFDCNATAIAARNAASGITNEDACVIEVTATNLEHEDVSLDLGDMSGPGPADFGGEPLVRIYDASGTFCYGSALYIDLKANESKTIDLACMLDSRHSAVNDLSVDARPAYVIVDYNYSKTRIDLD